MHRLYNKMYLKKTKEKSTFYRHITKVDKDIVLSSREIRTDTALDGIYYSLHMIVSRSSGAKKKTSRRVEA
jgi:hypothetical protein